MIICKCKPNHRADVADKPVGTVEELAAKAMKRDWFEPWCADSLMLPGLRPFFHEGATHLVMDGFVWKITTKPSLLKRTLVEGHCSVIEGKCDREELDSTQVVFHKSLNLRHQVQMMCHALVAVGCDKVWRVWRQTEILLSPDTIYADVGVIGIGGKRKLKE
jgi:hypothetical protein